MALPLLFVAGVLTSLTPCIYPMIPITAAIVGGQTPAESTDRRWRPLLLSLTYVVRARDGLFGAGTFCGAHGYVVWYHQHQPMAVLRHGERSGDRSTGLLDVLPVRIPSALVAARIDGGHRRAIFRGFIMGAMSGLVAAPCSAPVMAAVLTWVTTTKSAWLGFAYLFAFSLGMCALLVAVGVSSGALSRCRGQASGWSA